MFSRVLLVAIILTGMVVDQDLRNKTDAKTDAKTDDKSAQNIRQAEDVLMFIRIVARLAPPLNKRVNFSAAAYCC